jgi:hypothetical protein
VIKSQIPPSANSHMPFATHIEKRDLLPLLFGCLHVDPQRPDFAALHALDAASWQDLMDLAVQSKVTHQLFERLTHPKLRIIVPRAVMEHLRGSAQQQAIRYLCLEATLREILHACNTAGLPVIVLKGMHLAHSVYADACARGMGDIDLLFRRGDLTKVTAIFKTLGYRFPHNVGNVMALAPADHEYTASHPRYNTSVDIHWSLTHPRREASIDEAALWERASALTICGERTLGLALEDLIAYICFHASHHHYFTEVGLRPLVDIARISLAIEQPDWCSVADRSQQWGWARGVFLTLSMARSLLGAPVPLQALSRLRDCSINLEDTNLDDIVDAALVAIFADPGPSKRIDTDFHRFASTGSFVERIRLLTSRLILSRPELIAKLGLDARETLAPTYVLHIRRISRMINVHAARTLDLWRGDPARLVEFESQRRLAAWLKSTF